MQAASQNKFLKLLKMMKNKFLLLLMLAGVVSVLALDSCKKYADPPPEFEEYGKDTTGNKARKVLVISIDGVSGEALKTIAPPNIQKMLEHSKYSYNVLPSIVSTDASTWVTLLTGVGYAKHKIRDSTFVYDPGDFDENSSVPYFPTLFNYILPSKPQYNMAMVTPWPELAHYTRILNESISVAGDQAVKDSTISLLKSKTALGLMFVDFHEAELAGYAGSFSATDAAYKAAVLKADEYIGAIMNALENRENYDKEDWLVIVTTNHGGSAAQPKPGFMICANAALTKAEVKKAGFNAVTLTGAGQGGGYATMDPVVNGNRVYDFQKDFTIQFDALFGAKSGGYPYFFGNKWQLNGSDFPGFSLLIDYYPTWTFNSTSGSKFQVKTNSSVLGDSKWHTIGFTVKENTDGSRTVAVYLDGVFKADGNLPSGADLNSAYPLTIGWMPASGGSDYQETNVHNIKLFDVALDAASMEKNKCVSDYTKLTHFDDLVGFWACDEATGGVFLNSMNSQCPFLLQGTFDWKNMKSTVPCSVTPPSEEEANAVSIVPSNADVAALIFYWLNIEVKSDWNMDGQPWLNNFEDEIYDL